MSLGDIIKGGIQGFAMGGPLGAAAGAVGGALSAREQRKAEAQRASAAGAADPFAPYRGRFVDQLMGLYGMSAAPPRFDKQDRLSELEQRAKLSEGEAFRTAAGVRHSFSGAFGRATNKLRQKAVLSPEEQDELDLLRREKEQAMSVHEGKMRRRGESFIENIPGLQYALETGTRQARRAASAAGMGLSGNLLAELQRIGTGTAAKFYGQEANRLAQLAGATSGSPAAAAQIASESIQKGPTAGETTGALLDIVGKFGGGRSSSTGTGEADWWAAQSQYI